MINLFLIICTKIISRLIYVFNLGNGSTWPGHIALAVNKHFIPDILKDSNVKVILIAGTNGKTTVSSMIRTVLETTGEKVIKNESGANLLNGIASSLLVHTNPFGQLTYHYAVFEIDENSLPLVLKELTPDYIILNNLFRDQLDRYGEVDTIARKWKEAILKLPEKTSLVLNADDPQVAYLGNNIRNKKVYFGLDLEKKEGVNLEHAADSLYCPNCGNKLTYKAIAFSHLGDWYCSSCTLQRPKTELSNFPYFPLSGMYNKYNTLAAVLLLSQLGLSEKHILRGLKNFEPAFGRQEKIEFKGKQVQLFLSKNPTGFNESLRTISALKAETILFVLNDRIADGKDVSWIWDIDLEKFMEAFENILISGDRVYDMALRVKYAMESLKSQNATIRTIENLKEAIEEGLQIINNNETLYVLPTYTAMLEVRKILTGRKIL